MPSFIIKTMVALSTGILACGSAAAFEIRLKEEAHCAAPIVRLGDIAQVDATTTAEGPGVAELALFPAPGVGKSRELKRQELQQLLSLYEIDPRDVQWGGAETVVIRAGTPVQKSLVRPALHLIPAKSYIKTEPARPERPAVHESEELPRLVQRNQAVTIHSHWPGVKVTASGKALADGTLGEAILVEQADSRERVLAKVTGSQLVEIRPATK